MEENIMIEYVTEETLASCSLEILYAMNVVGIEFHLDADAHTIHTTGYLENLEHCA